MKKMEDSEIIQALETIGLSKNEVIVYLDLVKAGKTDANEISQRTKIHRTNVYDILNKLKEKGFVNKSTINDKLFFYPINPDNIIKYFRQKENDLKMVVDYIKTIQNTPQEKRKVSMHTGITHLKGILSNLLEMKEPIYAYGTPKEILDVFGGFLKEFHQERIKKKILIRDIMGIDAIKRVNELNKMEYTESRFLPSDLNSKMSATICGNKTIFTLWEDPLSAIVIESAAVADSLKKLHAFLWESAKIERIE